MNSKKQKKSGFTLVELMVVAIIVAILAAVAIPLMTGNKERAIATEAQAGCSTIGTALRMAQVSDQTVTASTDIDDLPGIKDGDLEGTYYDHDDYTIGSFTDSQNYSIEVAANATKGGGYVKLDMVTDTKPAWTYEEEEE